MKARSFLAGVALSGATALCALSANAGEMIINNVDPPGVGFNDKTPATPIGGNPGTTVGEQRLYAFRYAMDLWGARLKSSVPVVVQGSFAPLNCDANSGVLGSAGALQIFANFPGAKRADTWYSAALANAMAGVDLTPGKPDPGLLAEPYNDDIVARFNGNIGQPNCLPGSSWYYGLDNKPPVGTTDFLNVFMHELAHGLGFQNFISEADGLPPAYPDFPYPDIYTRYTKDTTLGKTWDQLTPAEIVASALRDTKVAWVGENVRAAVPTTLEPFSRLTSTVPAGYSAEFLVAGYGPAAKVGAFGGQVVLVNDGVVGGPNGAFDGCDPIPAGQVSGKIALIIRGTCTFAVKTYNAQLAGATGVIIFNNAAIGYPGLGGGDPRITIPTIGLTFNDGVTLAGGSGSGVVGLAPDLTQPRFGADAEGNALLYAPTTFSPGSSISHFDTRAFPNLLMEPFITGTLAAATDVDLTDNLLADVGWELNAKLGNYVLFGCNTGLPQTLPGFGSLAAGVQACANSGITTHGQFEACVAGLANNLVAKGEISGAQAASLKSCAAKRP
jgi:hypothetical protein